MPKSYPKANQQKGEEYLIEQGRSGIVYGIISMSIHLINMDGRCSQHKYGESDDSGKPKKSSLADAHER
jgi:hypothetical protein